MKIKTHPKTTTKSIVTQKDGTKKITTIIDPMKNPKPGLTNQNYRVQQIKMPDGKLHEVIKVSKSVARYANALCDPADPYPVGIPDSLITCNSLKNFSFGRAEGYTNSTFSAEHCLVVMLRASLSNQHYNMFVSKPTSSHGFDSTLTDVSGTQIIYGNKPFEDVDFSSGSVQGRPVAYGLRAAFDGALASRNGTFYLDRKSVV